MRRLTSIGSIHVALGELADVGVDRGREEQGLAGLGSLAEDPLDVGTEPDVEHPVGLVEDDVDDVAQVERSPLDVVEHAAGSADDDVDAPVEGADLPLDRLAAESPADGDVADRWRASGARRRSAGSAREWAPGRWPGGPALGARASR